MTATLVDLLRHNRWANLRLLDACVGLDDTVLDASAPGTFGRIRDTLVHLVAAEEAYLATLTGQPPLEPLDPAAGFPGLPALWEHARCSGEGLIAIAAAEACDGLVYITWQDQTYEFPAAVLMIQAISHAAEHRAHVATILSQEGVQPPCLDAWSYWEAERSG